MFRKQKAVKQLSADELKSKLYAHFDKSGSLQQLRTQVRSQLMSELFKLSPPTEDLNASTYERVSLDKKLLPLQVCNWLVYDHLLRQSYQYTLSTFVSETNLSHPDKLLTAGDVLLLFGLNNSTQEFKKISEMYSISNEKEHLHSLLLAIIRSLLDMPAKDIAEYEKLTATGQSENDNNKFLSTFSGQNKEEIGDHNENLKFKSIPQSDELNLSASLESSFHEQLQCVKDEKEKEIQKIRHKLLEELERLHLQERTIQLEFEQEKKDIKKERDLINKDREKLKEKETLHIKEQENKFESKVKEIEEIYAAKLHSKERELENLQRRLLEKEKNIGQKEFELSSYTDRFDSLKRELEDMNIMYKSVHEKYNSLLDENTNLVRKFQSMSDYDVIKEEISIKSKEMQILRQKIEDVHKSAEKDRKSYTETVANLELKLRAIEPQLHQTQQELNLTRDNLHMEETIWNKEKQKLEQESVTAKELYKTVLQRIEEQKRDIQDLHQTIHILHYELSSKDLNNKLQADVYNKQNKFPKTDFSPKLSKHVKSNRNVPSNLSQHYLENALNFTAHHKNRLHKLQQEAKANYDKYSLIYCSSLDDKVPKSNMSQTVNLFSSSDNLKLHSLPATKFLSTPNSFLSEIKNENFYLRTNPYLNFGKSTSNALKEKTFVSQFEAQNYSPNFQNTKLLATVDETNRNDISSSNQNTKSLVLQTESSSLKKTDKYSSINDKILTFQESKMNYNAKAPILKETHHMSFSLKGSDIDIYPLKTSDLDESVVNQKIIEKNSTNFFELEVSPVKTKSQCADYISDAESVASLGNKTSHDSIIFRNNDLKILKNNDETELSISSLHNLNLEPELVNNQKEESKDDVLDITSLKNSCTETISEVSFQKDDQTHISSKPSEVQTSHETTPVLIDLDAVWKRKTSLQSPPLFPSPIHSKNIIPDSSSNTLPYTEKELYSESDIKFLHILSNKTNEVPNKVISDEVTQVTSSANGTIMASSSNLNSSTTKQTFSTDDADQTSKTQKLNDNETLNREPIVAISESEQDICDKNIKQSSEEAASSKHNEIKQLPEDSLSELSEVHMSCGSEQEQQKEDSDNW